MVPEKVDSVEVPPLDFERWGVVEQLGLDNAPTVEEVNGAWVL